MYCGLQCGGYECERPSGEMRGFFLKFRMVTVLNPEEGIPKCKYLVTLHHFSPKIVTRILNLLLEDWKLRKHFFENLVFNREQVLS